MDITYLGHSCFKLKGKEASVVMDPYDKKIGFSLPSTSADIVTISHDHADHNAKANIGGTARRKEPYIISEPGEYEVAGVGVFGWQAYHDNANGTQRGKNIIFSVIIDGVRIVHLGDLGHLLADDLIEGIGTVDVLLVPVSGVTSIEPKDAMAVIEQLSPSIVIPMHFVTDDHNQEVFGDKKRVDEFLKLAGATALEAIDKFKVTPDSLPPEMQIVLMKRG